MKRVAVAVVLVLTVLSVVLGLWQAFSPFVPHEFWGVTIRIGSGRVTRVFPAELPPGTRIARGDRMLERPDGDPLRGYRLRVPEPGDTMHVATAGGVVTLHPSPNLYPRRDAVLEAIRQLTGVAVIAFAGLFFTRRPGVMALAFWISAMFGLGGGDIDFALDGLPRPIGLTLSLLVTNSLNYAGFALVSFALRFPSGAAPARWRWLDRALWIAFALSVIPELVAGLLSYAGRWDWGATADNTGYALPLIAAAVVFIVKQSRAEPLERSRIAWASAAFVTAAALRAFSLVGPIAASGGYLDWRLIYSLSNLCLLLAMYPVLRYRLFDLGFVVNRAALYSVLTLAAFATLAAANWVAQHFVTDRLAFVMQPIAAITIGLGYFRVRNWVQRAIERVLFRERFAAEEYLETVIRALPFVERADTVDDVLVTQVTQTLRLSSAALFRATGNGFQREGTLNWTEPLLAHISPDDILARSLLIGEPLVSLRALRWTPDGLLPPPPGEPVIALGILRRGTVSALVLYGRHANGTELEPEELRLLRRLAAAAAVAYETVDIFALRERNEVLERRVFLLETAAASTG